MTPGGLVRLSYVGCRRRVVRRREEGSGGLGTDGPAGLGIRESDGLITDNLSFFVPHTIDFTAPQAGSR